MHRAFKVFGYDSSIDNFLVFFFFHFFSFYLFLQTDKIILDMVNFLLLLLLNYLDMNLDVFNLLTFDHLFLRTQRLNILKLFVLKFQVTEGSFQVLLRNSRDFNVVESFLIKIFNLFVAAVDLLLELLVLLKLGKNSNFYRFDFILLDDHASNLECVQFLGFFCFIYRFFHPFDMEIIDLDSLMNFLFFILEDSVFMHINGLIFDKIFDEFMDLLIVNLIVPQN